jgi:hypothetical protein
MRHWQSATTAPHCNRHNLPKSRGAPPLASQGLGEVVLEYGLIGPTLAEKGVLPAPPRELLGLMGRCRNRLTHFYDDVRGEELRRLALEHRGDVLAVLEALVQWVREHPELVDSSLCNPGAQDRLAPAFRLLSPLPRPSPRGRGG